MDSSHALGVVPVPGHLCDFTVSAHYKFVLGVHDGMLGWNARRRERFTPTGAGWFSATPGPTPDSFVRKPTASRAEFGNVGHLGAYLLSESLDYLAEIGIDAAAAHARRLSGRLIEGMEALGLDVMTPRDPLRRAGNAAFATDDPPPPCETGCETKAFSSGATTAACARPATCSRLPVPDYDTAATFGSLELRGTHRSENIGQDLSESDTVTVALKTLSALQPGPPDFIKLDIEGMEEEALLTQEEFLDAHRPVVFCEHIKSNARALTDGFKRIGFQSFVVGINLLFVRPESRLMETVIAPRLQRSSETSENAVRTA
jgi:FkbM family methyltransferase